MTATEKQLAINARVIEQFRSGGEVEGMHRDRLLLLTTTGVRTGQGHTTPMMFYRDGGTLIVIASNMGAPETPAWVTNLSAQPEVTVEIGDTTFAATASILDPGQREPLWEQITSLYPFFLDHQEGLDRVIPLVRLTPRPS